MVSRWLNYVNGFRSIITDFLFYAYNLTNESIFMNQKYFFINLIHGMV